MARFPSLFAAVRYIVITIRNERIAEAKRHAVHETQEHELIEQHADPDQATPLEAILAAEDFAIEEAVLAYLSQLLDDSWKESDDWAQLTQDERNVLRLRYDGRTLEQVAAALGVSLTTVYRSQQRAVGKLRAWYQRLRR